ncbi:MAG: preprotein translocase subunit SecY [Labedaea sp.]
MLGAFRSALATPDLRRKILFTLMIIAVYRVGATLPSPGVSYPNVQQCINQVDSQGVFQLLNLFSGGALLQLSVFALGIMPYITASIIIQLLTVVIPRFEQLKKEGQAGQGKLTQYTRYLTIGLAILQATGIVAMADRGQLFGSCKDQVTGAPVNIIPHNSVWDLSIIVITMTAGTGVIMWLGELITERGVGNGMSLLMFVNIAARIPFEGANILNSDTTNGLIFAVVCAFGLLIIVSVVFVEQGQRRIPVQYAKRMIGRRMYGGTSTYLPLKVNQAGVIPVIFASSLLYLPDLISRLIGTSNSGWQRFINDYVSKQNSPVHIAIYFALIIFFTYFYITITFNVTERADEMKKFGGFIPGIRPGRPTAEYLSFVLSRITLPGSIYLGIIAVLPNFFLGLTGTGQNQNFPFGGTAVLIMVGVGLDTVKQIESQLMQRNYEGFLR